MNLLKSKLVDFIGPICLHGCLMEINRMGYSTGCFKEISTGCTRWSISWEVSQNFNEKFLRKFNLNFDGKLKWVSVTKAMSISPRFDDEDYTDNTTAWLTFSKPDTLVTSSFWYYTAMHTIHSIYTIFTYMYCTLVVIWVTKCVYLCP